MKRNFIKLLSIILVLCMCFAGCGKEKEEPEVETYASFSGRVLRVDDGSILVQPAAGTDEQTTANLIWIHQVVGDIRVGDWVQVSYDGVIEETYPAKIPNHYGVAMDSRVLTDDLEEEILEALSWDDVTFFDFTQQNGVAVIGCRNGEEVGFVVLLKGEDGYSLEETYIQTEEGFQMFTGVMGDRTVYIVTDPDIYALQPVTGTLDPITVYHYPTVIMPGVDTEFTPLRNE